jgi:hypothetical protein
MGSIQQKSWTGYDVTFLSIICGINFCLIYILVLNSGDEMGA